MATKATARILIVDDHPMIRELLGEYIRQQPDLTVCGEAASAAEALQVARQTKPDAAIVDLTLKDSSGMDLIRELRAQFPALRILVLSMHEEALYAERALHAGAHGYVAKQEATQSILAALRRVLNGETYVSDRLAAQLLRGVAAGQLAGGAEQTLSDQELAVFRLIGQGWNTRQIAEKLNLSAKTVESYRARIKQKLQLQTAGQLMQRAVLWVQEQGKS
jgi:DNA-binding NarL/FixJ family response regulator